MDKNQAIGFVLMAALLMVYFYFFAPKPGEQIQGAGVDTVNTISPQRQQLNQNNSIMKKMKCGKLIMIITE